MITPKSKLLFFAAFCLGFQLLGQTEDFIPSGPSDKPETSKKAPEFPGGNKAMYKLIKENLEYPESALENRIGGKVIVRFVVDTTGNARDIEVLQGVSTDIDQEAVRLVGLLNNWTQGTIDGKKPGCAYKSH